MPNTKIEEGLKHMVMAIDNSPTYYVDGNFRAQPKLEMAKAPQIEAKSMDGSISDDGEEYACVLGAADA